MSILPAAVGPESIIGDGVDMASGYCLFAADAIVQNRQSRVTE